VCGSRAQVHDRREHLLRDVPVAGRATVLVWWKRIWRCPYPACSVRTWTQRSPLGAPRQSLTGRAKAWVTRRVGADGEIRATATAFLALGRTWSGRQRNADTSPWSSAGPGRTWTRPASRIAAGPFSSPGVCAPALDGTPSSPHRGSMAVMVPRPTDQTAR
jgi:hypothetical protein